MADETAARKQARDKTGDDLEKKRLDDLRIALIDLPKLDNIAKALSQELKKLGDDVDKYHDDVAKGKKMSNRLELRAIEGRRHIAILKAREDLKKSLPLSSWNSIRLYLNTQFRPTMFMLVGQQEK